MRTDTSTTTHPPLVERARRLLILEPMPNRGRALRELMEAEGHECVVLQDGDELLRMCAELEPDLLLLASDVGGVSGLEYCGDVRAADPLVHLPIILLGSDVCERACVAALLAGADDYVVGVGRSDELRARVRVQLRSKRLFDTLKRVRGERDVLRRDAQIDPLTGLPNRRALMTSLLERCDGTSRFAVLFLDVDRFKAINDTFGHDIGDRVLVTIADVLNAGLRPGDLVSRYGGEEFVALLAKAGPESTRLVAERLRASVEEIPAFSRGPDGVTLSIGATLFEPGAEDETPRLLLVRADQALYEAKNAGRNRVVLRFRRDAKGPSADGGAERRDVVRADSAGATCGRFE